MTVADILHDCTLAVQGQIAVIVGPNGAGKSTAMKAVFGMLNLRGGHVRLDGEDITHLSPQDRVRKGMGFVPQVNNVFPSMSVEENLEMGAFIRTDDFKDTMEQVYHLFPILKDKRRQPAGELSGGQRQQVAVGRALMTQPKVLMLDEPTAGVSPIVMDELFDRIIEVARTGISILMVEQNARQALEIADQRLCARPGPQPLYRHRQGPDGRPRGPPHLPGGLRDGFPQRNRGPSELRHHPRHRLRRPTGPWRAWGDADLRHPAGFPTSPMAIRWPLAPGSSSSFTWLFQSWGISFGPLPTALLALPFGICVTALLVLGTDRVVYRYYRRVRAKPVIVVIASMGVMFVMSGITRFVIGVDEIKFSDGVKFVIDPAGFKAATGLAEGLALRSTQVLTVVTAALVVWALFWFLGNTRTGKSMRAYSDNEDLALLSGINPERVVAITWIIASALAVIAGTLYGLDKTYKAFNYFALLLPIFAAAVVGGLGNPLGAIAGGFLVAFSEVGVTYAWKKVAGYILPDSLAPDGLIQLLSTDYKFSVSFAILILVLLFKPTGIFKGKAV